jgi:DNA helicase-2/ATP-dependent DNA helicase PcrA
VFHGSVFWTIKELKKKGIERPTIAILGRSNVLISNLTSVLSEARIFKGKNGNISLPAMENLNIVWDSEISSAAGAIVASILEWSSSVPKHNFLKTLQLISKYFQLKNAIKFSKKSSQSVKDILNVIEIVKEDKIPRKKTGRFLLEVFSGGLNFSGNPESDWLMARKILEQDNILDEIYREAKLIRLFRSGNKISSGLSELWLNQGNYFGATKLIVRTFEHDRLVAADIEPKGCSLMTIHKSKGKEFDGVVLVEPNHGSSFIDVDRENPPYLKSRRLLRVGITRARFKVVILRSCFKKFPLVG